MITHLATAVAYVADQQASLDFFVDKLGFELRTDGDMGPQGRWIEIAPPGAQTVLVLCDAAKFDKADRVGDSATCTFASDDVATTHKELSARGVTVTEPVSEPWGTYLTLTDPDGNTFLVAQT